MHMKARNYCQTEFWTREIWLLAVWSLFRLTNLRVAYVMLCYVMLCWRDKYLQIQQIIFMEPVNRFWSYKHFQTWNIFKFLNVEEFFEDYFICVFFVRNLKNTLRYKNLTWGFTKFYIIHAQFFFDWDDPELNGYTIIFVSALDRNEIPTTTPTYRG